MEPQVPERRRALPGALRVLGQEGLAGPGPARGQGGFGESGRTGLGPPARCPFTVSFLVGRVPLITKVEKGYSDCNLSTGGPRGGNPPFGPSFLSAANITSTLILIGRFFGSYSRRVHCDPIESTCVKVKPKGHDCIFGVPCLRTLLGGNKQQVAR